MTPALGGTGPGGASMGEASIGVVPVTGPALPAPPDGSGDDVADEHASKTA